MEIPPAIVLDIISIIESISFGVTVRLPPNGSKPGELPHRRLLAEDLDTFSIRERGFESLHP